ncbi:TonB-dependent receptor [Altererythrobacter marinus]|uniref:TonB-dependent receptor n=1 Tax=Pelagerythrobacter marinus TaxID=538382 RepID=A0ABW9UZW0_9SPHN|nr:TonB-dependent receptor [Pelagerythrobacter marinus]MXO69486.1 TonB-dependent receptor [Pelagerythrobacter marinus]
MLAGLLAGTALAVAVPAMAQSTETDAQAPTGESATAGEPAASMIVVTARKQEETLLDVPIAVSAFDSARIEDRLAQDVGDLAAFTPGFQIQESFGRSFDRPVIRGASNILMAEGKVGVFLDGIPFFGDFSSLDLANVERVEVIKGPQSAVFGRGTLSGAINVVLKRPGDELEGKISATVGEYDRRELSAFVSTPITPWLGVQAGAKFYDIDGQFDNTAVAGERLGDQNTRQYMAGVYLDPSPDMSLSLRWLHQRDDDSHYAIGLQPASENNCFLDTRPYYCGEVEAPDTYGINSDRLQRPGIYRNADRFLGDFSWDIAGSGYEFSFQAGYSDLVEVIGTDQSYDDRDFFLLGSPVVCGFIPIGNQLCTQSGFNTTTGVHRKTETYEARITSPGTDRFRWRLGAYTSLDRSTPMEEYLEASELGLDMLGDARRIRNRAVFGGIDFDVTEALTLGAELRHQVDKVRNTTLSYRAGDLFAPEYLADLAFPNPDQIVGEAGVRSATFKATLPRFTANWAVSPDLALYAQYSQGNSPGGFNTVGAPEETFDEEKLTNYEIGLKTNRWGFDYLNLSLFWQDYSDQVLTSTYQTETRIDSYSVNIGKTRIRGLELEGAYPLIGRSVSLQFNYTYLDAEIRRGIDPDQAVLLLGAECKTDGDTNLDLPGCREAASVAGNRPPLVSKHSGAIGLRTEHEIAPGWSLFSGADLVYRSSFFAQVHNLAESGDSTRVNLQLGVRDDNGLRVTLWGKNVFGDETPVGILRYVDLGAGVPSAPSGDSSRAFAITPARKAEFGLTVSKAF